MVLLFNTGSLYKNVRPISKEAIDLVRASGADGIELFAGLYERVEGLTRLTKEDVHGFNCITLHAPTDFNYSRSSATQDLLKKLSDASQRLGAQRIVFHPLGIEAFDLFDNLPCEVAFENLDKKDYRTLSEFRRILDRNSRRIVLDMTHAFIVDPTLQLARDIQKEFADRICQYHISGFRIHSDDGQSHYPISETLQTEILQAVLLDRPMVIESVFPKYNTIAELKQAMSKELDYIRKFFSFKENLPLLSGLPAVRRL